MFTQPSGPANKNWKRLVSVLAGVILTLAPLGCPVTARAMDRSELGQVLRTIPPNGPFESYGDVVLRPPSGKGQKEPVVFPHWVHRQRYSCRVCHLELRFSLRSGETLMSRGAILGGKYCGACHNGETAFSVRNEEHRHCDRCHGTDRKVLAGRFREFAAEMPGSRYGNGIDWTEAFNQGRIEPAPSLDPAKGSPMNLPDKLRQPLELGTTSPRSGVLFYHEDHMELLDCSNCHPDIFDIQKKGTEFFTMDKNIFGWFCGSCHMRVAFPMNDCHRCHPEMRNNIPF